MKIHSLSSVSSAAATTLVALREEALPRLNVSTHARAEWPKRRSSLTLQTGLERPRLLPLAHERSITAIARQPYSHGGFMALTRSFWQDPIWLSRLTRLMPEMHQRTAALLTGKSLGEALPEMMALLENNPILAAYGTSRAGARSPAIEWDIWLNPHNAADLSGARVIHGNAAAEHIATQSPNDAGAILTHSLAGSDVHTGPDVLTWKTLFDQALGEAGHVRAEDAPQPLFLDVKSTFSSAEDINQFVQALHGAGFSVKGVGTFAYEQLNGLHAALPVHLFDTAEDLVHASAAGTLPKAAAAMFNGGFLLQPKANDPNEWQIDPKALRSVAQAQMALGLHLAIYIQETRASWQALDCLTRCINANAHIFAMGFAYSGLRGVADTTTAVGRGVMMLYAGAV